MDPNKAEIWWPDFSGLAALTWALFSDWKKSQGERGFVGGGGVGSVGGVGGPGWLAWAAWLGSGTDMSLKCRYFNGYIDDYICFNYEK